MEKKLEGKVALVDGATRGAGRAIAIELSRMGAYVYATGRSSRTYGPSDMGRPETIEETGEMMLSAGGNGIGLRTDHLDMSAVDSLISRIESEQGKLDILVNDIFGGDVYMQWDKKLWEHDLDGGLRMLRMGIDTHLITSAKALPLMLKGDSGLVVEVTDGTSEFNKSFRKDVGFYYDLVKATVERITIGLAAELTDEPCAAVAVTPGWLRSERMLEKYGVREENWRDSLTKEPSFCISETPFFLARGVAALAGDPGAKRFSGRVLSSADLAREYGVTDLDGTRPDFWRYHDEVEVSGRPPDDTGYR